MDDFLREESEWLLLILDQPEDEVLRHAFADWLEERGRWRTAPGRDSECRHDLPECHRITEIRLRGATFRVCRCVSCGGGRFFMFPIEERIWSKSVGVPHTLRGEALHKWLEGRSGQE